MGSAAPTSDTAWTPLSPEEIGTLLTRADARWWLSGGAALDRWLGESIRERVNVDISTTVGELEDLVAAIPAPLSVWVEDDGRLLPWSERPGETDLQPVRVFDESRSSWVLQINVEDGNQRVWVYKRDPRLQLPWDRAVLDIDGIPTGAPEVQLVWKALRPRPEDERDHDAVVSTLSDEARAFYETALLRIHPHSTWAIHVRSPFAPAKASWNRPNRG